MNWVNTIYRSKVNITRCWMICISSSGEFFLGGIGRKMKIRTVYSQSVTSLKDRKIILFNSSNVLVELHLKLDKHYKHHSSASVILRTEMYGSYIPSGPGKSWIRKVNLHMEMKKMSTQPLFRDVAGRRWEVCRCDHARATCDTILWTCSALLRHKTRALATYVLPLFH